MTATADAAAAPSNTEAKGFILLLLFIIYYHLHKGRAVTFEAALSFCVFKTLAY